MENILNTVNIKLNFLDSERYETRSKLTEGGMGIINIVFDKSLKRVIAMKVLPKEKMKDSTNIEEFLNEAIITAHLEHPNIIPVHDIGSYNNEENPFYTMKLVEGESLFEIIRKLDANDQDYINKYPLRKLILIFRKVCDAIAYAHSRRIIHRDLKPENIMVGDFGEVLLLDWGLAKYCSEEVNEKGTRTVANFDETDFISKGDAFLTTNGIIKGSLAYIAPEQAFAEISEIDRKTDIFLLGATLYHIITRRPPYEGNSQLEIVKKAEIGDFRNPREFLIAEDLPNALVDIVMRAMKLKKEERFSSVKELILNIDNFLSGRTVSSYRIFEKGEFLMKAGAIGTETYVLVSGKVQVKGRTLEGEKIKYAEFEKGAIIGELAGITMDFRTADVVAMKKTEALVITHELLMDELRTLPPWMESIVVSMAERIASMDKIIHPFLAGNPAFPILTQLYYVFCLINSKSSGKSKIPIQYSGLISEISQNLAIPTKAVLNILDYLHKKGICTLDKNNMYNIVNLGGFGEILTFFRNKLDIGGSLVVKSNTSKKFKKEAKQLYKELFKDLSKMNIEYK
ncbi:MAG: protein kinase [Verrucomicrobiota bacterium]|nr:protein kinase [Verrucomicrobiota bacterium]